MREKASTMRNPRGDGVAISRRQLLVPRSTAANIGAPVRRSRRGPPSTIVVRPRSLAHRRSPSRPRFPAPRGGAILSNCGARTKGEVLMTMRKPVSSGVFAPAVQEIHGLSHRKIRHRPGRQAPRLPVPRRDLRRGPAVRQHRGVVAGDPRKVRPRKDQPYYHLLAENPTSRPMSPMSPNRTC